VAALAFGIREDFGLLLAGVLCIALLLWRDHTTVASGTRERYA
jgi:hypothetical protein